MATNGNGTYNWNNRGISPDRLLSNAYQTIGKDKAEELGLHCLSTYMANGYEQFNFDMKHLKLLERTVGNIWIKVSHTPTNPSSYKNGEGESRLYGALVGSAGLNMSGQGTLQSDIPCIVVPDHKDNTVQKNASSDGFAAMVGNLEGVTAAEVNAAAVNIYESTKLVNGLPAFRFAIIEASGVFGECLGVDFRFSIRDYPVPEKATPKTAPKTSPKSNRTPKSPRVKTPQTPADDQTGDSAEVDALAFAG